jgi:hypothetical protein
LPTANGEAVGEADGVDTVWPRRGFANSCSFPTAFLLGKNSFANSRTLPSVFGFWAVGEDFFPDNGVFLLEEFLRQQLRSWLLGKLWTVGEATFSCCEASPLLTTYIIFPL